VLVFTGNDTGFLLQELVKKIIPSSLSFHDTLRKLSKPINSQAATNSRACCVRGENVKAPYL
jgi:hypothetical protein